MVKDAMESVYTGVAHVFMLNTLSHTELCCPKVGYIRLCVAAAHVV